MSYDIYLNRADGDYERLNPTYNLGPMFREALPPDGVKTLNGHLAAATGEPLLFAIDCMEKDPEHFKQFDPPNGWGDYEDALWVFRTMLDMAVEWPDAVWEIR